MFPNFFYEQISEIGPRLAGQFCQSADPVLVTEHGSILKPDASFVRLKARSKLSRVSLFS